MKIVILTRESVANLQCGDWHQAISTVSALKRLGYEVNHYVFSDHSSTSENIISFDEIDTLDADVFHFIGIPYGRRAKEVQKLRRRNRILAASTIFWDSYDHRKTLWLNGGSKLELKRFQIRRATSVIPALRPRLFSAYDLLLPNSEAECRLITRYFKLNPRTRVCPVPNAISPIPDKMRSLEGYDLPSEYIVYPGHFARRKNQLGFLKAVRELEIPVVFMGGPLENDSYMQLCIREAPENAIFLGNVKHRSELFYRVLGNARIACLTSSCETPGIALLEGASMGARPVVTKEGSAHEYFGFHALYCTSTSPESIQSAVKRAWELGRLSPEIARAYEFLTWDFSADCTAAAYRGTLAQKIRA